MSREILVDGYNVIKRTASFQTTRTRSLAVAREQLITLLVNRYRHTPHQVIIVFDGDGALEATLHDRRIRIIYSRHDETADSVIARLAISARSNGREVEIYSDDIDVQQSVAAQGGVARTAGMLERQIHAAPRDIERRARYRIAMRRKYRLDSDKYADDEESPSQSVSKKKRKHR